MSSGSSIIVRAKRRAMRSLERNGISPKSTADHNAIRLVIRGKVQGVGFRDFVARRATRAGLRGWVRNRSDGTVEVVVSSKGDVEDFLAACRQGPRRAQVEGVGESRINVDNLGTGFIRRRRAVVVEDPVTAARYDELGIDTGGEGFASFHRAGRLASHSSESVTRAKEYWRQHYKVKIGPALHIAYESVTGEFDERVVPPRQYRSITRLLNDDEKTKNAYVDKSLYQYLVRTDRQPRNYVKRINGRYFDEQNNLLGADLATALRDQCSSAIIKPSRTANGLKVAKLNSMMMGESSSVGSARPRPKSRPAMARTS